MTEDLSKTLKAALLECNSYAGRGGDYFWRRASMMKLMDMGYVEPYGVYGHSQKAFQPTAKGFEYIKANT